jgi:hypothetical protein
VPPMGPAGNQSEVGDVSPWFMTGMSNFQNSGGTSTASFVFIENNGTGTDASDPGNGTYGDLPAYLHVGRDAPYFIGSFKVKTVGNSAGTFISAPLAGAQFVWLSGNDGSPDLMGMGTQATRSSPNYNNGVGYSFASDSVAFINVLVPEPSSVILSACGLVGLLAYAWRKRK